MEKVISDLCPPGFTTQSPMHLFMWTPPSQSRPNSIAHLRETNQTSRSQPTRLVARLRNPVGAQQAPIASSRTKELVTSLSRLQCLVLSWNLYLGLIFGRLNVCNQGKVFERLEKVTEGETILEQKIILPQKLLFYKATRKTWIYYLLSVYSFICCLSNFPSFTSWAHNVLIYA